MSLIMNVVSIGYCNDNWKYLWRGLVIKYWGYVRTFLEFWVNLSVNTVNPVQGNKFQTLIDNESIRRTYQFHSPSFCSFFLTKQTKVISDFYKSFINGNHWQSILYSPLPCTLLPWMISDFNPNVCVHQLKRFLFFFSVTTQTLSDNAVPSSSVGW